MYIAYADSYRYICLVNMPNLAYTINKWVHTHRLSKSRGFQRLKNPRIFIHNRDCLQMLQQDEFCLGISAGAIKSEHIFGLKDGRLGVEEIFASESMHDK